MAIRHDLINVSRVVGQMVYSFGAQLNMFGSRAHEARFKLLDRKNIGAEEAGSMPKSSSFAGTPNFDQVEVGGRLFFDCLPDRLPVCLPAHLPAHLPACLPAHLPTCPPASPPTYLLASFGRLLR